MDHKSFEFQDKANFAFSLQKETQNKLTGKDITDHDRYVLNRKLDVIKEIRL